MKRHANLLWIVVLVLGWFFDFLFWKQSAGINFLLYTALCLLGGVVVLSLDQKRMAAGAAPLVVLSLFFAAIAVVRAEPLSLFLGVALTLTLLALLAITFLKGDWLGYALPEYLVGLFKLALSMLVEPLKFNADVRREPAAYGQQARRANLWPVLRGLAIAVPVLLVFGALLASADVVFGAQMTRFIQFFRLEDLPQHVFRLIYILVASYALAGAFLHAAAYGRDEKTQAAARPASVAFLGFTEAAVVLGSVAILFGAFVLVQFHYFFGGQANISLEGYTYSEYARRGFGELLLVAFFSLVMILALSAATRRESEPQRRAFSGLSVLIVALVTVMLVSAYQRLALYEIAYGFSRLRTYSHVFLIWIGILLVAVVVLEILRRERAFAAAALMAAVGFAATLSLLNVDHFIARQNVDRAAHGQLLDVPYLVSLSTDSVPALAQVYASPAYSDSVREAVGAVLACRLDGQRPRANADWRSFNLSRWNADAALAGLRSGLSRYQYAEGEWPARVLAPGGSKPYDCQGIGMN
jgi:hypothetical protein